MRSEKEARWLVRRPGPIRFGAGELDVARLRGLGMPRESMDAPDRGVGSFRYEEGVVQERGLKWWPTTKSIVLALEFHRGLLLTGVAAGLCGRLAGVGVAVDRRIPGEGEAVLVECADERDDFRGCGTPEYRLLVVGRGAVLPRFLLEDIPGVDGSGLPPVMTTDEAGELPGVSTALPVADLSVVMMLEIESLSCAFRFAFISSIALSIESIRSVNALAFALISVCSLMISPFTVNLSLRPF